MEIIERFFSKVALNSNGCWEWLAYKNPEGYAIFWNGKSMIVAHRWYYEYLYGLIPVGLEPDHLCNNKGCVNSEHIEPVTHQENMRRAFNNRPRRERLDTCKRGHPYSKENTYVNARTGNYHCRECMNQHARDYRRRVSGHD